MDASHVVPAVAAAVTGMVLGNIINGTSIGLSTVVEELSSGGLVALVNFQDSVFQLGLTSRYWVQHGVLEQTHGDVW